jgi:hypothetical protein
MMLEFGPFRLDTNVMQLKINEEGWYQHADLLFGTRG